MADAITTGDLAWEKSITATARAVRYPATPNLAARWGEVASEQGRTPARRLRLALVAGTVAALLCVGVVASPLRADLLEWLRFGSVSIRLGDEHVALPSSTETAAELGELLAHLGGETTLEEAATRVPVPIMRPSLLPEPDHVFLARVGDGDVVSLLWLDEDGNAPAALLQIMERGAWAMKMEPASAEDVLVNGERALWTSGPYFLITPNGEFIERRLVTNHALIWQRETTTYRLESSLALTDAVRLAESLQRVEDVPVEGEE